jgi:hypothetical protein
MNTQDDALHNYKHGGLGFDQGINEAYFEKEN